MGEIIVIDDDGNVTRGNHHGNAEARRGWSALMRGKTVGGSIPLQYNSLTGQFAGNPNILELSGDDEDATELSLSLSSPRVSPNFTLYSSNFSGPFQDNQEALDAPVASYGAGGPYLVTAQAIVSWGVGGVQNQARVDMCNGAGLTIHASFVRVVARLSQPADLAGQALIYQLGAQAAPGRTKFNGAQCTDYIGPIDTGVQSAVKAIPKWARRVSLLCGTDVGGTIFVGSIRFFTNTEPANAQYLGEYTFTGNASQPVPIPNGAYYYTIISGTAAPNRWCVIFDLGL